jgi:hypothetical protein
VSRLTHKSTTNYNISGNDKEKSPRGATIVM